MVLKTGPHQSIQLGIRANTGLILIKNWKFREKEKRKTENHWFNREN